MTTLTQLPPVSRPDAKTLILGSMNGRTFLENARYYDHSTNQFWQLMSDLFDVTERTNNNYEQRVDDLKNSKIALWSPIERCTRQDEGGHLTNNDSDIADIEHADIRNFLLEHSKINLILFNGRTSEKEFKKYASKNLDPLPQSIRTAYVPSSSGLNSHTNYDGKLKSWANALVLEEPKSDIALNVPTSASGAAFLIGAGTRASKITPVIHSSGQQILKNAKGKYIAKTMGTFVTKGVSVVRHPVFIAASAALTAYLLWKKFKSK